MLFTHVRLATIVSTIAAGTLAPGGGANAELASINAFNNFHVEETPATPQNSNPYQCLFEDNGAVYNKCAYKVTLDFNLPVNSEGEHTIYIRNYWNHAVGTSFNCIVYACPTSLNDHQCVVGGTATFTAPYQQKSVSVATSGAYPNMQNMALICWNLSTGDGIATMNYNP
ncbi:hypothetical protein DFR50_12058 [Roseiarcus fermentans]|uniref:Uncharacterized protein n=1 Tax=Roseiarcus fermentans TaxID=1473586 RepID=A0A366F5D1_9HYPH|nr:hypothetical protein [Roseiarcus fermentans]RBP09858.1 hypothetical protein DFR50_12058 [Roseiarcus fermentans]